MLSFWSDQLSILMVEFIFIKANVDKEEIAILMPVINKITTVLWNKNIINFAKVTKSKKW